MQQLRLFPRDQRHCVVLINGAADPHAALRRRLRRSGILEVQEVPFGDLGAVRAGLAGPPAAVVFAVDASVGGLAGVSGVLEEIGDAPMIAVSCDEDVRARDVLELGVEEVLELRDATAARLEHAVLAAVYRRSSPALVRNREADPLTGLATRDVLARHLPELLEGATDAEVAVLYCDLDRFKRINDTSGHAVGDLVLRGAADRVRRAVRASDLAVRVGGDEFVVVLRSPTSTQQLAQDVARRIVGSFSEPFDADGAPLAVSMSIGVAANRVGEDADSLLARADRALYLAKRRGRSRVANYDDDLERDTRRRARSAEVLAEAMRRDLLEPAVHQVVDPGARRVVARLHRPSWGRVADAMGLEPPTHRPEAAAGDPIAPALFEWTIRHAAEHGAALPQGARRSWVEMPPAVLMDSPGRLLAHTGDPGELVVVVEEAALSDTSEVRSALLDIARSGVRVVVGGFGSGGGSIGLLERHPFEAVWLDRQAVDGISECPVRAAKLAAVAGVAGALGQRVVVERPTRRRDAAAVLDIAPVLLVESGVGSAGAAGGRRPDPVAAAGRAQR